MTRWAPPLLVLLALLPVAGANFVHSGTYQGDQAHVPQMHCEFVQTEPASRADPLRCELNGPLRNAMVMRVRIAGPGHVYAFLFDEAKGTQVAQVECTSVTQQTCLRVLPGTRGVTSPNLRLHAFLDGTGPAVATVTVEKVEYSLP
ncbi:MAG TPA: hypothetical protein VNX21_08960 [Candidatus Thermoplasmatota archaeon]|nr:hypothetical protein [Candidatus Thermoplasmatota archaeon]